MNIETYIYEETEEAQAEYELIKSWSPETMPIPALLPKLGVIVRDELGTPLLYMAADMSNSTPRAYLECLQTNPVVSKLARYRAAKMAESFLTQELKKLGYSVIIALTQKVGVAILAQRLGYWISPKACTYFSKEIV